MRKSLLQRNCTIENNHNYKHLCPSSYLIRQSFKGYHCVSGMVTLRGRWLGIPPTVLLTIFFIKIKFFCSAWNKWRIGVGSKIKWSLQISQRIHIFHTGKYGQNLQYFPTEMWFRVNINIAENGEIFLK